MTTGRINQVTILRRWPRGVAGNRRLAPPAEQCTLVGGRPERYLSTKGSRSVGYNRFPRAIQLPPLCSPRDGPRHGRSGARRLRGVPHLTRRRRIPSAHHARSGYGPGLTPKCLVNNDSHRPVIHRLQRHPRLAPRDVRTPSGRSGA